MVAAAVHIFQEAWSFYLMRIMLFLCLFASIPVRPCEAQSRHSRVLDPELRITQYVHDVWGFEDGLPQNSVYTISQTRDGYVWVGTQEGLARFDGIRFTIFEKANAPWLKSNEIWALLPGTNGSLWIGTSGGGIAVIHEGKSTTYSTEDGLPHDFVKALYESDDGNVWIGTFGGGISRFDGQSFKNYTAADGLADDYILSIGQTPDQALWFGTTSGLSRLQDGHFHTFTKNDGLPGEFIRAVYPGKDGLWIGTDSGIARIRNGSITSFPESVAACGATVSALYEDSMGALWIGSMEHGVCRLYEGSFQSFSTKDGLTHNLIRAFFEDSEGNLWIGTDGGGLNRLSSTRFVPLTTSEGLSGEIAVSVIEDSKGILWIGTEGDGLNRIENGKITHINHNDGLPSDYVFALHEDRSGKLWIGMYGGGICSLDSGRLTCYGARNGLPSENIWSIFEDSSGRLWVGTDAGLLQLEQGTFKTLTTHDGLSSNLITALLEDRKGNLWIGTPESGLNRMSPDGNITVFTTETGLSSNSILSLYEDKSGNLWIGTKEGGLCRRQSSVFNCYTVRDGLYNDNVLQILEDEQGSLWLGSQKGISRVSLNELEAFAKGEISRLNTTVFGRTEGLKSIEAVGGSQPNAWKSRDGRLWFATIKGVASIQPASITTITTPPPVQIESIRANGQEVDHYGPITLEAGVKNLEFDYTANTFYASSKTIFKYRLEGYDDDWIEAGTRRSAYYTHLPPGNYTFHVIARNADGVWNEQGASLTFQISPFFYETTLFRVFSVLVLVLLGFAFYSARIKLLRKRAHDLQKRVDFQTDELRKKQRELERQYEHQLQLTEKVRSLASALTLAEQKERRRISQILHDDLQQVLYGIQMKFRLLLMDIPLEDQKMRDQVKRSYELVSQAIDTTRRLTVNLSPLVLEGEGIVQALQWLRSNVEETHGLKVDVRVKSPISVLPEDMRVFLFQLTRELLFNIVKHAGVKEAVVELEEVDARLIIRVIDHGVGFVADLQDNGQTSESGFGLYSVRERLELFNGQMSIDSSPGKGTCVTLTVPLNVELIRNDG